MAGLRIGDGRGWSFMGSQWSDGPDGELLPPEVREGEFPWLDNPEVECLAVRSDEAYGDFSARFRFRSPDWWGSGAARLLFRMQDSRRFYALDVPWCGQQVRTRHFWAGMVIADGTALQRYLNFGLVPGLCAKWGSWYEARVEARGPRLRAWIEDILVADVEDHTAWSRGRPTAASRGSRSPAEVLSSITRSVTMNLTLRAVLPPDAVGVRPSELRQRRRVA
jgi:hypothetical protein